MSVERTWKTWLDRVVLVTVIWCIFSFRVFLIEYQGTGVRLDDILIAFLILLFAFTGIIGSTKLPRLVLPFILYVSVALFSSLYNGVLGRVDTAAALVYSIRNLEYFMFFYMGVYMAQRGLELYRIFHYYFLFLVVLVPLQMADLLPAASRFSSARAIGNTSGPYELAAVSAFLSFYFYFHIRRSKLKAFLAAVILFATASRVTNVAFVLVAISRYRARFVRGILAVVIGSAFTFWLTSKGDEASSKTFFLSRVVSLTSPTVYEALGESFDAITPVSTSKEFLDTYYLDAIKSGTDLEGDASTYIRVYRWIALVKSSFSHADSVLVGLGPSFASVAVDGFIVRLLIETGVIGLALYLWFIVACLRSRKITSAIFKNYAATLLVTSIAIDIFVSYKAMLLFWLYFGLVWGKRAAGDADGGSKRLGRKHLGRS